MADNPTLRRVDEYDKARLRRENLTPLRGGIIVPFGNGKLVSDCEPITVYLEVRRAIGRKEEQLESNREE